MSQFTFLQHEWPTVSDAAYRSCKASLVFLLKDESLADRDCRHGPNLAPDGATPERANCRRVVRSGRLTGRWRG